MSVRIKIILEGGSSIVVKASSMDEIIAAVVAKSSKENSFRLQVAADGSVVNDFATIKNGSVLRVIEPLALKRRVVPADNSCLFSAVSILCDNAQSTEQDLRAIIARTVMSDQEKWNAAILDGRSAEEYAEYIRNPKTWGGSIELMILADHFTTQLVALDIIHLQSIFHPDQASTNSDWPRAFLLWDGIHYDPVVIAAADDTIEKSRFSQCDLDALHAAETLSKQAHADKQFTDTTNFVLQCLVCGQGLKGQADCLAHAQATGHSNFGEVASS